MVGRGGAQLSGQAGSAQVGELIYMQLEGKAKCFGGG
ncbi:hypothetical protein SDC9_116813 [bioreactor metagenome]|uniref:Uncharacterized protein n=1 Tax=bioreactor metagenome TaxID=1076179 RepID=A0A645BX86_9ZZZZ